MGTGWFQRLYPNLRSLSNRGPEGMLRITMAEILTARPREIRERPRLPGVFDVRLAQAADRPLLREFVGERSKAERLLATGDACLLAVSDGCVHAMEWVRYGPAEYRDDARMLGVVFRIPERSCWLHNGRSGWNGHAVGPWGFIMGRIGGLLKGQGVESLYLQVESHNRYSIACHRSAGFRDLGRLVFVRVFGRALAGYRPACGRWSRLRTGELDLGKLGQERPVGRQG